MPAPLVIGGEHPSLRQEHQWHAHRHGSERSQCRRRAQHRHPDLDPDPAQHQLDHMTGGHVKRRQAPGSAANLQDTQTVTSAESEIISSENRVELMMALQQLDAGVREVIYMRLFGELSFREIGEVLGRSENWVRVTFYRGKERLKKNISGISKGGTD